MDICVFNELEDIWNKHQNNLKDDSVFKRKFVFARPQKSKILITGINPSDNGDCIHSFTYETAKHAYFTKLRKIETDAAYLDLFYVRGEQRIISTLLNSDIGLPFMLDQLKLTQRIIEDIVMPKLILVFNKESWGFWGYYAKESIIWMGYDLELVEEMNYGNLMRIKGFVNHPDRISDRTQTNLKGSLIYFSKYMNRSSDDDFANVNKEVMKLKNACC